jgi:hypothetical protein
VSPSEAPVALDRRRFLRRGIFGGALLLCAGSLPFVFRTTRRGSAPRGPLKLLSADEHAVFAAVAARMVPGDGADARWPRAEDLDCAGKIDALMATTHPDVGRDFRRLLHLCESGFAGLLLAGSPRPFTRAEPAEQDARLEAWRRSRLAVLRSGYQALKRLASAAYYGSPEIYELIGYPGPPFVPQAPAGTP